MGDPMLTQTSIRAPERLRKGCVRLLALRTERAGGADVGNSLRDEARAAAATSSEMRGVWDEVL